MHYALASCARQLNASQMKRNNNKTFVETIKSPLNANVTKPLMLDNKSAIQWRIDSHLNFDSAYIRKTFYIASSL